MASVLEQLACENPDESLLIAALVAPIRAIAGWSKHESLFVYAWIALVVIWLLLYYAIPLSFLNSSNGLLDVTRVFVSTLLIFAALVIAYVSWARKGACARKLAKASYRVYGIKPGQPGYLYDAVKRVEFENPDKPESEWQPMGMLSKLPSLSGSVGSAGSAAPSAVASGPQSKS